MGGAMASLLGLTFGFPAVTFEAPGDDLPAKRLGLTRGLGPGSYNFGNTADPVVHGCLQRLDIIVWHCWVCF